MRLFEAAERRTRAVRGALGAAVAATALAACNGSGSADHEPAPAHRAPRTATTAATTATATAGPPANGALVVEPPLHSIASVGPLFSSGVSGLHTCTAAVVASASHDVVVTAAHCVSGTGSGTVFVPGYDEGRMPYGTWLVQAVYVPPAWLADRDPHADYAFLVVTPSPANGSNRPVESVVGGSTVGAAPATGEVVTIAGYVAGRDDDPVICSAPVYVTSTFPTIDCPGYASGTSGSPWLADYDASRGVGVVTGVIGGLNHGGCTDATSYAAPFDATATAVLARAAAGGPADTVPGAGPDGC